MVSRAIISYSKAAIGENSQPAPFIGRHLIPFGIGLSGAWGEASLLLRVGINTKTAAVI